VQRVPSATGVCAQVPSGFRESVVQGLPSSHWARSQITVTLLVSLQSPSEAVTEMVTVPVPVQEKRGLGDLGSLISPLVDVQEKLTGAGTMSVSCAVTDRLTEPPTMISAGDADTPSTTGQMLRVPLTVTLPVRGAS